MHSQHQIGISLQITNASLFGFIYVVLSTIGSKMPDQNKLWTHAMRFLNWNPQIIKCHWTTHDNY